jgi:hypothetical protein
MLMAAPLLAAQQGRRKAKAAEATQAADPAAAQPVTDDMVTRAIEKGREWLTNQQTGGLWPEKTYWHSPIPCGNTEIATLTLLYTGSNPVNSAVMNAALDALIARKLDYTYAAGCRAMAYATALKAMSPSAQKRDTIRTALIADAQYLVNGQREDGGWAYQAKDGPKNIDFSNTQFAILALWEASKVGIEIPAPIWKKTLELYQGKQKPDGS